MRIAIYTSFALNYLAKARVLARSVKDVRPDIDVIAIVCDKFRDGMDPASEPFDQIWMVDEYPADNIKAWIFRHNIMELCTAVKGWGLRKLLDAGYDYVFYLDPDCWVLEDPQVLVESMKDGKSVLVVPHTMKPAETAEAIRIVEFSSLKHGIFNLGFLLVRNGADGLKFADWWATRLRQYCLIDFDNGVFTDQRWFDLAVGYFPFIQICWHKGVDVASWNIGEREITRSSSGGYLVDGDPLICYHFSGVGPAGVHRWVRDKLAPADPLAAELEFRYEERINAAGQQEFARLRPAYDSYEDGTPIEPADRVRLRKMIDDGARAFDPYRSAGALPMPGDSGPPIASRPAELPQLPAGQVEKLARRLFDAGFFAERAGIDKSDGAKAWQEYKRRGWRPTNVPSRFFDVALYLNQVPAREIDGYPTPLHHFVAVGARRRYLPVWFFDERSYLELYPDVAAFVREGKFGSGFEHYCAAGHAEGRRSSVLFDEAAYLRAHNDVARAVASGKFLNGGEHYVRFGHKEGRRSA